MKTALQQLVEISRYYGQNNEYIIGGGGNTSYKDNEYLYVKASGTMLGTIDEKGFAVLDRKKLNKISLKQYSTNTNERDIAVKNDLYKALLNPFNPLRPSVETSLHNCIDYSYVIHTHPTLVNALMCGKEAKTKTHSLFGNDALFIEYVNPGYTLFKLLEKEIETYKKNNGKTPQIIFLQNHGVFVSANSIEEIKSIYKNIETQIAGCIKNKLQITTIPIDNKAVEILPAIRMMLGNENVKIARIINNSLISNFSKNTEAFEKIRFPFTPDNIVYCGSHYLYIQCEGSAEEIVQNIFSELQYFKNEHNCLPKIIIIKNLGLIAIDDTFQIANTLLDVFVDMMKISYYAENFGGPNFMTKEQIAFIENWEGEHYRRSIAKKQTSGKVANKIAVITGGAQGFGAGIAQSLFNEKANVVIADLKQEQGDKLVNTLNNTGEKNFACFVKTDVSNEESVKNLITQTVLTFGGIDIFISNAGILYAGSLDEFETNTFELMTKVNYIGYYLCTKYASKIMKIQNKFSTNYYTDIIQINSKSGLKGSNKNFSYAGTKFGGIGLTQSFAMELIPHRIKVNSICPGNFFEGPLWSDPQNGLFVQYLRSGKVPGAKTINDVKKYYESQVPCQRGCYVEDVMKAIYYLIEQEYETGQAVPVTGGQIMLK